MTIITKLKAAKEVIQNAGRNFMNGATGNSQEMILKEDDILAFIGSYPCEDNPIYSYSFYRALRTGQVIYSNAYRKKEEDNVRMTHPYILKSIYESSMNGREFSKYREFYEQQVKQGIESSGQIYKSLLKYQGTLKKPDADRNVKHRK